MSVRRSTPVPRAEHLRRLAFFREFSTQEIRNLVATGNVESYKDGELLATEGTRKQRRVLYVVLRGKLQYVKRVRAERAVVVMALRPGDVGGFLTFLNEEPSPVSVRSVGQSAVLEIGRRELQNLAVEHAALAVKLLRVLVGAITARLVSLIERVAATSAWALDLDHHLTMLPLLPGASEAD